MNIQAMMKQAQKMQKDLMNKQAEIEKMEFETKQGFVTVKMNGKKEVVSLKIDLDADFKSDDKDILEDMIKIAINNTCKKIDQTIQDKMGALAGSIPGIM
jgi:DNA-binding YbaB/EbfC family protein